MNMERVPMTIKGAEAMKAELKHLKTVNRPRIVEAISTARAHGDLSENAEYHAAKEEQGFNEGRIKDLEDKISRANIIDTSAISSEKIVFGATVELIDMESGKEVVYRIVGVDEADIEHGMVSITSPIARALIGKKAGDMAEVQAPGGVREYEIQAVDYL